MVDQWAPWSSEVQNNEGGVQASQKDVKEAEAYCQELTMMTGDVLRS